MLTGPNAEPSNSNVDSPAGLVERIASWRFLLAVIVGLSAGLLGVGLGELAIKTRADRDSARIGVLERRNRALVGDVSAQDARIAQFEADYQARGIIPPAPTTTMPAPSATVRRAPSTTTVRSAPTTTAPSASTTTTAPSPSTTTTTTTPPCSTVPVVGRCLP